MAWRMLHRAVRILCATTALVAAGDAYSQTLDLPRHLPAMTAAPLHPETARSTTAESRAIFQANDEFLCPDRLGLSERLFGTGVRAQAIAEEYSTPAIITIQSIEPIPDNFADGGPTSVLRSPSPQYETIIVDGTPSHTMSMPGAEEIEVGPPDMFPAPVAGNAGLTFGGTLPCGDCGQCADCQACQGCKTWQVLPTGLIYHSYLAGPKEPRFAAVFFHDSKIGWQLDYTVGGRMGLVRYGTTANILPQGWQLDIEGAAFPRVNLEENMDLDAADYRVGLPLTYGKDRWQAKLAVYHLSAHVGDEFLIRHPSFNRRNYVRDAIVLGGSWYPVNLLRLYGEVEYAFHIDGGAEPWAFQFGFEVSPRRYNGCGGDPFLALNTYLREDVGYGGNLCFQVGWQWRGVDNQRLLRTGFHLLTGKSNQYEFLRQHEDQIGIGFWYDF